ncbi:hypothetical protein TNCV_58651 [Trichonephila clavipes]|nr:hypothetical protein TNCV_58651 [Trichonephila clavipes]
MTDVHLAPYHDEFRRSRSDYVRQCRNSLKRQSLKKTWTKLWPELEGRKGFNDDHREDITDFVQSIPRV